MTDPTNKDAPVAEDNMPSTAGQGGEVHEDALNPSEAESTGDDAAAERARALADTADRTAGAVRTDGPDHHGHDGTRDTLTAGEAQSKGALGAARDQTLPAMSQNNATDVDKIAGIVAQTRQDIDGSPASEVRRVLAQRFAQTGISLPDDEIDRLVRQVVDGEA